MPTPHYDRVKEFMQKVGQDTPEGAIVPDEKIRILRAKCENRTTLASQERIRTEILIAENI